MITKNLKAVVLIAISMAITLAGTPAYPANNGAVYLDIRAFQEEPLRKTNETMTLLLAATGWFVFDQRLTMNLEVQVGNRGATFRGDGTKRLAVAIGDQDYSISGNATITLRARDLRGNTSTIRHVFTFLGDGRLQLSENEAGTVVPIAIRQVNWRPVMIDTKTGEGETELILGLAR